jgi:hypothetical protein
MLKAAFIGMLSRLQHEVFWPRIDLDQGQSTGRAKRLFCRHRFNPRLLFIVKLEFYLAL